MGIKNLMEEAVQREVRLRLGKAKACSCALCELDAAAFALNQLPPRYVSRESFEYADVGHDPRVRNAVAEAMKRISSRPRHRPGSKGVSEASLENHALRIGAALVEPVLSLGGGCACARCCEDVLAYALNRYRPKYGVSSPARPSYQQQVETFLRHEIRELLAGAAKTVQATPRH